MQHPLDCRNMKEVVKLTNLPKNEHISHMQWALGYAAYHPFHKSCYLSHERYAELPTDIILIGMVRNGVVRELSCACKRVNNNTCVVDAALFHRVVSAFITE